MNNFREVNDDILKDWLDFREETDLAFLIILFIRMKSII